MLTVCDSAAGESCPLWLGRNPKMHWGLVDPSRLEGSDAELEAAFMATIAEVEGRVRALLDLPLESCVARNYVSRWQVLALPDSPGTQLGVANMASIPPSTGMTTPLTKLAKSEAR